MEIVYCDTCGLRIPNTNVMRGVSAEGSILCEKCRPASTSGPADAQRIRRGSSATTLAAQRRTPKPVPLPALPSESPAPVSAPRGSNYDRPAPATRERHNSNSGMLIGAGIAFGCVSLLGLFFMFSGGSSIKSTQSSQKNRPEPSPTPATVQVPLAENKHPENRVQPDLQPAVAPIPGPAPSDSARTETFRSAVATPPEKPDLSHSSFVPAPGKSPFGKADPEEVAQKEYDILMNAMAKADNADKIKRLEAFIKAIDGNTFVASRARTTLSSLKKAEEATKPAPAPLVLPTPVAEAAAPANASGLVFKEDFENPVVYGVNYGSVSGDLPGGRAGKATKFSDNTGRDKRTGIYAFALQPSSEAFKTDTLIRFATGMKLQFMYYGDGYNLDVVLGYHLPGNGELHTVKHRLSAHKTNEWITCPIALTDFKNDDAPFTFPADACIARIEFWDFGGSLKPSYIDDIQLVVEK
jgi:hypothetical protein